MEPTTIDKLPDVALLSTFSKLNLEDRLAINQVCRRWYELSRVPWKDVTSIDIGEVKRESLLSILRKCPRITCISGDKIEVSTKYFSECLQQVAPSLKSLKLYHGWLTMESVAGQAVLSSGDHRRWPIAAFHDNFLAGCGQLEELVWHSIFLLPFWGRGATPVCRTVKRLQITGYQDVNQRSWPQTNLNLFQESAESLEALLINDVTYFMSARQAWKNGNCLRGLVHLRELGLYSTNYAWSAELCLFTLAEVVTTALPNLKVLIVEEYSFLVTQFAAMLARPKPIELLVFGGFLDAPRQEEEIAKVRREWRPNASSTRVLHLAEIANGVCNLFRSATLSFSKIDDSLPDFLSSPANAHLLEQSWVARQIAASVAHNADFWNYRKHH